MRWIARITRKQCERIEYKDTLQRNECVCVCVCVDRLGGNAGEIIHGDSYQSVAVSARSAGNLIRLKDSTITHFLSSGQGERSSGRGGAPACGVGRRG